MVYLRLSRPTKKIVDSCVDESVRCERLALPAAYETNLLLIPELVRVCACVSFLSFSVNHELHPDTRFLSMNEPDKVTTMTTSGQRGQLYRSRPRCDSLSFCSFTVLSHARRHSESASCTYLPIQLLIVIANPLASHASPRYNQR